MPPVPPPRADGVTHTTTAPLYHATYGPVGAPRLLVLHGGPGASHEYLLPQLLRLAERYELVFYDQRGGGRSKSDSLATVTWRTQVADLAAVANELVPGPLHILGYSWGALLALLYTLDVAGVRMPVIGAGVGDQAAHPIAGRSPTSLTLLDPAPVSREFRQQFEAEFMRRQQGEAVQQLRADLAASGLRERDANAYRQRAFELSVAGYFFDPTKAHDLTPFRVTGRVQQSIWESLGDFDLVPALGHVTCPTLVVHGREDPIPLASSEAAVAAMPDAQLAVLEQCGHVPYVEQPEALFAAVEPFLARQLGLTPLGG